MYIIYFKVLFIIKKIGKIIFIRKHKFKNIQ